MTSEIATIMCMLCQKSKTVKLFQTTKLAGAVFDVEGAFRLFIIIRYLQYTSSLVADEVELPTLLLATHPY